MEPNIITSIDNKTGQVHYINGLQNRGYVQTVTTNGTELQINNWEYQFLKYPHPYKDWGKEEKKQDWDKILKDYLGRLNTKEETKPKENTMKQVFAVAFEVKRDDKNKVTSSKEIWTGWVEVKANSSIDLIVGQAMNKDNITFDANTLVIKVLHTVSID